MSPAARVSPLALVVHAAAEEAFAAGFSIGVARQDGSKRPDGPWKEFQERRITPEEFDSFWPGRESLGIFTGAISGGVETIGGEILGGVECLEFDDGETFDAFVRAADAADLGPLVAMVAAAWRDDTPREGGGVHLVYRCSSIAGNTKLAERYKSDDELTDADREAIEDKRAKGRDWRPTKGLIETRGEGGWLVIAPSGGSTHPTGRPYRRVSGGPSTIATITPAERDELFRLSRVFNQVERQTAEADAKARAESRGSRPTPGDWVVRPGDAFNQRHDLESMLVADGWRKVRNVGADSLWRRPGKADGWSATLFASGWFYNFSSSAGLPTGTPLDAFGYHAHTACNGDFRAATKSLLDRGYGEKNPGPRIQFPAGRNGHRGSANGAVPPGSASGPAHPPGGRPTILITTEEHDVADQAIGALDAEPNIFTRAYQLVTVLADAPREDKRVRRPKGAPSIALLPGPRLREMMSARAAWAKQRRTRDGDFETVPAHVPDWAVAAVGARGIWPTLRPIEGVVEAPTIRPDGTILDVEGWDEMTGLVYRPNAGFGAVPGNPTHADAAAAAGRLLDLVADFPFLDDSHRAVWLALVLTLLGRHAIDGPCPLFLFDANTPGSGKTKLVILAAILLSGRPAACVSYPDREEEMNKTMLAIALASDPLVLFDNLATGQAIGGKTLDGVLTAMLVQGRILGMSRMSGQIPAWAVITATGNNLGIKGDGLRRILPCRLESPEVRPEERKDFRIKGDLVKYAMENRAAFVIDALTILRAFHLAGRPRGDLLPMDYPAWCELIRQGVHWAIGIDPCATRAEMVAADPETAARESLASGWAGLCRAEGKTAMSAAEAGRILEQGHARHTDLDSAMREWTRDGSLPSARVIGNRLNKLRGRMTSVGAFDRTVQQGCPLWFIRPPRKSSGDSGDSENHLRGENRPDNCSTKTEPR